ncbi:hypothetical protein [Streptomyces sp. NPDC051776]|uniref:hypothetical protein n=1 Tax=Streptomyces sp. NPDC051776 TaxID=3155414 RepID=UPI0034240FF3
MRVHKIATTTMLVLAVSGWAVAGSAPAFANMGGAHERAKPADTDAAHETARPAHKGTDPGKARPAHEGTDHGKTRPAHEGTDHGKTKPAHKGTDHGKTKPAHKGTDHGKTKPAHKGTDHGKTRPAHEGTDHGKTKPAHEGTDHGKAKPAHYGHPHHHGKAAKARAEGGSATAGSLFQQNVAQSSRQNNNCNNPNDGTVVLTGARVSGRCVDKDGSFNKHTLVKDGEAFAEGGSSTGGDVFQQNIAQKGRQNNNCNNPNSTVIGTAETPAGGRLKANCKLVDHSANVETATIGGGAKAEGGSSTAGLFQQNVAQEGRQNNNCNNPNNLTLTIDSGSRAEGKCIAVDRSTSFRTVYR